MGVGGARELQMGGDFNQTLDDHLERKKIGLDTFPRDRAAIHILQEELGLIDIWRRNTSTHFILTLIDPIHE